MTEKPINLEGAALEAFNALPQPIWAFDRETTKFVWANDAALEWLGFSREALYSKTIIELRPPAYHRAIREAVANFKGISTDSGAWPIINGRAERLLTTVHWRRASFNGREVVLATAQDITQSKRILSERDALRAENDALRLAGGIGLDNFRRLIEKMPGNFLVLKAFSHEIVVVSDDYAAATMVRREDVMGRSIFEIVPNKPDDPDGVAIEKLRKSLERVDTLQTEDVMAVQSYPVVRPDGSYEERYWTAVNSSVSGPDGKPAYIIHRSEDVTALYIERTEEGGSQRRSLTDNLLLQAKELRQALTRTNELEARFRTGERLLDFGMWEFDFETRRMYWSERIYEITGRPREVGPPDLDEYTMLVHPEDRPGFIEAFSKFDNGEAASHQLFLQHRIARPDGSYRILKAVGERNFKYGRDIMVGLAQDVTNIVETQENLVQIEKLWKLAGEKARLGGWRMRTDNSHLIWTRETAAIHEVPFDEPPTLEEALAFYTPETRPIIEAAFRRCIEMGETYDVISQLVTRGGKYLWVRSMGEPEYDEDGNIIGAQGGLQDVTELVEARERSEELERRLTSTLEHMGDAFYLLSPRYEFLYLNKQAEKLLRRSREGLIGRYIWEAFPESKSNFLGAIPTGVDPTQELSFEFYYDPFDAWFEVEVYPVPEGIAVYFRDISRQRAREMQLKLLEVAVERLNDVVMITDATPVNVDQGPRIVYVNEAFVTRTGYTREEVIGKTPRILQGPGTDRQVLDEIRRALEKWQPVRAELLNYKKSGEEFWLELEIVPITNDQGDYTHWVSIERDVTERRSLEERLRESQKLEAMGRLTGGVAHDFNNLLTVILGNAELLTTRLNEDAQLRLLAEMTAKAAERGAELTSRLLAFARRQALQPKTVDVNKLIASIEPMLRRTISAEIELEFVRGAGLWLAEIDPGQLEVALLNLAINARDAMPDGGKLTIETCNAHLDDSYAARHDEVIAGQYVMISVSDTGTGMAQETLARAFEPFYTTKEVGKGSGLGLSMVFGFAKQSGGHVKIYSEPGQGTSVKLYFPRLRGAKETAPETSFLDAIVRGSEHILVVEDDDMVREHLSGQLAGLGYRVTDASNGPAALQIIGWMSDIDMLLTDIVMPGGMNGRQLADEALKLRPDLKVLFSSGYSENAIVHHGRLDAGVELLSKPYRLQDLAAKVRKVLDRSN
jgi:PAS domain S-box-containing protein